VDAARIVPERIAHARAIGGDARAEIRQSYRGSMNCDKRYLAITPLAVALSAGELNDVAGIASKRCGAGGHRTSSPAAAAAQY
jgi:hypothetical protein